MDPLTICVSVVRNGRIQLVALDRLALLKGAAVGAVALVAGPGPALASTASTSRHLDPAVADHLLDVRATLVRSDSLLGLGRLIVTVAEQLAGVQEMLTLARAGLRTRMFEIAALFADRRPARTRQRLSAFAAGPGLR